MSNRLTARQLRRLQTLYHQHAAHALEGCGNCRDDRLAWAGEILGHTVASFSKLSRAEAATLIDILRRPDAQAADEAGNDGHKSNASPRRATIASADDLKRIERAIERLGWDQARLEGFLRSPSSPLRGRTQIRTVADANRVWWALKRLLQRAGLWTDEARPAEVS